MTSSSRADASPDTAPCRVYLVRHGRTALNAQGRFRGRNDPPLDEVGWEEARWATACLRRTPLVAIFSSPLQRAVQTAGEIAKEHGLPVGIAPELADLDYGAWAGRTRADVESVDPDLYKRFRSRPEEVTPPGGESVAAARERVEQVLYRIAEGRGDRDVVAVTHELPIRLLAAHAKDLRGTAFWRAPIPTGSVTEVLVWPGRIELAHARRGARGRLG